MNRTTGGAGRYSLVAMAFHWILAILIGLNFAGAWASEELPRAERLVAMNGHKAMGITILLLTVARIGWRLAHNPPALLDSLKAWEIALAKVVHALAYAFMLAVPLAGWAMHSAASKGAPVAVFGLFSMPALPVGTDKPTIGLFHELHETFASLLLALAVVHVLAALKHMAVDRDGTMRRMLPWG